MQVDVIFRFIGNFIVPLNENALKCTERNHHHEHVHNHEGDKKSNKGFSQ